MTDDHKIRELCFRVSQAKDAQEFKSALAALQIAIRKGVADVENLGIHLILNRAKMTAADKKDGTKG